MKCISRGHEYDDVELATIRYSGFKALDLPHMCVFELEVMPPHHPPQINGSWGLPPNYGMIRV